MPSISSVGATPKGKRCSTKKKDNGRCQKYKDTVEMLQLSVCSLRMLNFIQKKFEYDILDEKDQKQTLLMEPKKAPHSTFYSEGAKLVNTGM